MFFALLGSADGADVPTKEQTAPRPARLMVDYPLPALRKGIEGTVELQFTVHADGKVTDVRLLNETPKALSVPVMAALRKWNAGPWREGDPPRPEVRTQRFEFKLAKSEAPRWPFTVITEPQLKALKVLSAKGTCEVGPEWTKVVEPAYPADLPRPGSKVTVEFDVGVEGKVSAVEFPKPIPDALATAVKTALEGWRFRPATKDRQPVAVRVRFVFEFNRLR